MDLFTVKKRVGKGQKFKRFLSLLLCLSIFVGTFTVLTVNAEVKSAYIFATSVAIRTNPTTKDSEVLIRVSNVSVNVNSETKGEPITAEGQTSDVWYNVTYNDITGYVCGLYVSFPPSSDDCEYDEDFEKNLANFPESYHSALRALHTKYPNWQFVANKFDLTFKEAVEAQYGVSNIKDTRKWVEFTYGGNEWRDMRGYDVANDSWATLESRWTYASRAAIEYFMDPRNSLNEDMIFAFMKQSYQEDAKTQDNLRSIIKGTFLENGYDKNGDGAAEPDAYIEDLIAAANESGVSPYVLAATIIVEQGSKGETNLISGTYPEFEGYYNFFNFSTTGSTKDEMAVSGLTYAKNNGWNSRTASIIGGAKKYADGYISIGQDTYYYKDFNVVNKVWWHQYASALYDAWTNAKYLKKGCVGNTDAVITFSIPVFSEMPQAACPYPTVQITPPVPEPVIKKGDTNKDDIINAIDLAAVKMDILGVKKLEGDAFVGGDVNGDGVINAIDLAAIKMHILGVKAIS